MSDLAIPEDLRIQYKIACNVALMQSGAQKWKSVIETAKQTKELIERIAGQAAKLAALANELLAANMAWSNKCEENAALTSKLAESRAALKDAESRALTPCPDCGWIAGERTVLLDMEDNSENAD